MHTPREAVRFGPMAPFVPNAVRVGNTIYLSGMVSIDENGQAVAEGDMVGQWRQAYAHVRQALAHFGASMEDIVDETVYVTDMHATMREMKALWKARREAFGCEPAATQALVEVKGLSSPRFLVEIKCIAVV